MRDLPIDRLRQLLSYDPQTGVLVWLVEGKRGKPKLGAIAGCSEPRGYIQVRICGKLYWAHRVALALTNGTWPEGEVDHIDGDKGNNRLANLRSGPKSLNMQNLRSAMASNKSSGLLGSSWSKQHSRWQSAITVNGKTKYLGLFDTAESAHNAYVLAKRVYHKGCSI